MRLPILWLRDHVELSLPSQELAERLAMTGTEVDRVLAHGVGSADGFVVGKVLSAEQHPDADRLRVCVVDVGEAEPAQIVCGAPNVAAGQTVAVARPGAVMPGGVELKKAKLRGVVSEGMILAEDEVELGTDHAGIMVLEEGPEAGSPLADVLPIHTDVLELEITPNRPDCLGVLGVSREVHAITGGGLSAPATLEPVPGEVPGFSVSVQDPDLCPRFTAVLFEDVTIGPSPAWLKARLSAAGQRPINNVVDITNFVMLLSGQPMHAFDADLVAGGTLTVRRARDGEKITTLDDVERTLDSEMVVIEDADGPTSIAGVMGGQRSEVRDTTTRVLMEAATWNGPNIKRTSHKLALRTEASGRFEKGLQPEQGVEAQAIAAHLMVELCGARMVDGFIDVGPEPPPAVEIALRAERIERLLGTTVAAEDVERTLTALGFGVTADGDGAWSVTVPHWRRDDVTREADLIEEVARLVALEDLPATLPSRRGAVGVLSRAQRLRRRAEDALLGAGVSEIAGWSFTGPETEARLGLDTPQVRLVNPMSEDQSRLRTTLLGSLLEVAERNRSRGMTDIRIWEAGSVYRIPGFSELFRESPESMNLFKAHGPGADFAGGARDAELPEERRHLAVLLTGALRPPSWGEPDPPRADFFAAKGVLAAVMDALRVEWSVEPGGAPFMHPGRAARILVGGRLIGGVGELHPRILEATAGFELDLDALIAAAPDVTPYVDLTSFPAVRQDLAVTVPAGTAAADVLDTVREAGGALLIHAEVFDVYRGAQVGEGKVSLALRLEFRAADRTLTDDEVAQRREKIVSALGERFGADLRA